MRICEEIEDRLERGAEDGRAEFDARVKSLMEDVLDHAADVHGA
jgi:hypothetical protein